MLLELLTRMLVSGNLFLADQHDNRLNQICKIVQHEPYKKIRWPCISLRKRRGVGQSHLRFIGFAKAMQAVVAVAKRVLFSGLVTSLHDPTDRVTSYERIHHCSHTWWHSVCLLWGQYIIYVLPLPQPVRNAAWFWAHLPSSVPRPFLQGTQCSFGGGGREGTELILGIKEGVPR